MQEPMPSELGASPAEAPRQLACYVNPIALVLTHSCRIKMRKTRPNTYQLLHQFSEMSLIEISIEGRTIHHERTFMLAADCPAFTCDLYKLISGSGARPFLRTQLPTLSSPLFPCSTAVGQLTRAAP